MSPALGEVVTSSTYDSAAGAFRLTAVSLLGGRRGDVHLLRGALLEDLQGESFTLATLRFTSFFPANRFPELFVRVNDVVLSDAFGNEITPVGRVDALVRIPAPPTLLLLGVGLAAWLGVAGRAIAPRRGKARLPQQL